MLDSELKELYEKGYQDGIRQGIKLMEQRLLLACENGNPINIEERAYFIKSDIENLRDIFENLERRGGI